jgi:hypothetical protein
VNENYATYKKLILPHFTAVMLQVKAHIMTIQWTSDAFMTIIIRGVGKVADTNDEYM